MIFPIGDEQVKGGAFPMFSYLFIVLNVLIYFFVQPTPEQVNFDAFFHEFGAVPSKIVQRQNWLSLLTSIFLHGGIMHLLGNMLFLWIFADNIEASIGSFPFLLFYAIGGIAATAAHIVFDMSSTIPTIGASGAISAVMGAYIVMYPTSRVKVLVLFFVVHIPAFLFLGYWFFQQWMSGSGALQGTDTSNIAWWAHIGGFAFGVLAGLYYRLTGRIKTIYTRVSPKQA